jgi:hypothetical protein
MSVDTIDHAALLIFAGGGKTSRDIAIVAAICRPSRRETCMLCTALVRLFSLLKLSGIEPSKAMSLWPIKIVLVFFYSLPYP